MKVKLWAAVNPRTDFWDDGPADVGSVHLAKEDAELCGTAVELEIDAEMLVAALEQIRLQAP